MGWKKPSTVLNARARDFVKFGRLYTHKGTWNGQPIVPAAWVQRSTQGETTQGSVWEYPYHWWLASETEGGFHALGLNGQYLYGNPQWHLIIVKFRMRSLPRTFWRPFFRQLAAAVDTSLQTHQPSAETGAPRALAL